MIKTTSSKKLLILILILISYTGMAQTQYTMSMTATAPTDRTIDVTLSITATNPSEGVRFGGYSAGINFNTAILNGGTISAAYVPNSKATELSNLTVPTPNVATLGHVRLSVQTLTGANGVDMAQGTTLILGTYKITNTVAWASNSNASLWLQNVLASGKTNSLVNGYPFGLTTPATSYTTTAPVGSPGLILGYTSSAPLSLILNASAQDCATLGNATTTPVTCFAGTDGSATITMSALTPSLDAITYTVNGGASQNTTLVSGAFTITGLAVGSYSVVVSNAGCPDITVPVTVSGPTTPLTNVTTETACDSYTWSVTGLTYTAGGSYNGTTVNGSGCVVNETLNLTITNNPIDYANLQFPASPTICEGGTLTAYGQVYEAGVTEAAGQGAGITVEFGLSATNTNPATWTNWSPATFNVQVGNNDEYQYTTSNALVAGTYYYTFRYVQTGCTGWQYGGNPNGFWNGTSQNSGVLTITPVTTNGSVTTSICAGDSYTWPLPEGTGLTYTTAQTGLTNVVGCNTATLNLTITPATTNGSVTTSICAGDSYTWPLPEGTGLTYTTAQTGLTNVVGCNTATLNLTITPATTNGSVTTSICAGDSYTWPLPEGTGLTYTTAQTGLTNVVGCNTATLNLTITPVTTNGSISTSICAGDSYTWPLPEGTGLTYTTAQTGLTNVVGCNTATLNLTITPVTTNGSVTTSICAGDSYTWPANGVTYSTAQSGVTVVTGCNTATLNLTVNSIDYANLQFPSTATICQGSTLTAYGQVYEAGITEAAGQGSGINVEFGFSPVNSNTNPSTWTNWTSTGFNVQVGNNDEYQITTGASLSAGTYYYTFRYKLSTCTEWQYGGYPNGFWNGTSQNSGVLTINPSTTNGSISTSICAGDSYTWPLPEGTGLTYTTAQTGLTNVVGCNTATLNLTINTSPTPTGSAAQTFNVVDLNDATIANLVVSPIDVIWYGSLADAQAGTNALPSTTVLTNGATYWSVNVSGGCSSTPFAVTVTVALGVDGFDNANFKVYPNPTSGIVTINYSENISSVVLMNLLGQIILDEKPNLSEVTIDLSSLPSATYFVKVESNGKVKVVKVIKKD